MLDQAIPSLVISFAVRVHAEQAMQRGRVFKERPLQMNWYIPSFVKAKEEVPAVAVAGAGEGDVKVEGALVKEEVTGASGETVTEQVAMAGTEGSGAVIKEEGGDTVMGDETESSAAETKVNVIAKKEPKTEEEELEDELIGGGGDELPSGDVDDELRLDDEEEDLESEERSWRR